MTANDLASAIGRARALLGECSSFKLELFCAIVASGADGIEQLTLATHLGAQKQRVSAAVRDLTDVDHLGLPGPGYARIEVNAEDRRSNVVRLTDAGARVAGELFGVA